MTAHVGQPELAGADGEHNVTCGLPDGVPKMSVD